MKWLKKMGLRRAFFLVSVLCMAAALLLTFGIYQVCAKIYDRYPHYGVVITSDGVVTDLGKPTPEQQRIIELVNQIQLLAILIVPVCGLGLAGILFYYLKLKEPIAILSESTKRIRMHDLDFSIPEVSADELGQICAAFETMRAELLRTNQELWRQAEERRRLNAAFAHDLRNPITVLKGTVKMLRQEQGEEQALERLETYTLRIEQYVEAMSSIQRLEQMPVRRKMVRLSVLSQELQETARLLAPAAAVTVMVQEGEDVPLDHGLFLTVAENLIGNAVRYANNRISIRLSVCEDRQYMDDGRKHLIMTVADDGNGYPVKLITEGPKPFGKMEEDASHFGMGLYTSSMLCTKHGGMLVLTNEANGGAKATAVL